MGDYWQLTVDILQNPSSPIVEKPKLQEKYLTKPPFRYLHDVITAVRELYTFKFVGMGTRSKVNGVGARGHLRRSRTTQASHQACIQATSWSRRPSRCVNAGGEPMHNVHGEAGMAHWCSVRA